MKCFHSTENPGLPLKLPGQAKILLVVEAWKSLEIVRIRAATSALDKPYMMISYRLASAHQISEVQNAALNSKNKHQPGSQSETKEESS